MTITHLKKYFLLFALLLHLGKSTSVIASDDDNTGNPGPIIGALAIAAAFGTCVYYACKIDRAFIQALKESPGVTSNDEDFQSNHAADNTPEMPPSNDPSLRSHIDHIKNSNSTRLGHSQDLDLELGTASSLNAS